MLQVSDIILWTFSTVAFIVAVVFVWIESQPDTDVEDIPGYYDYSSGLIVEEWNVKVRLGRIPYLNKHLVIKKLVASVPSPHTTVSPYMMKGSSATEIDADLDWFEYSYGDSEERLQIYLKRRCLAKLKMHTKMMFRVTQQVSRQEVISSVKRSETVASKNGATSVTLKLENITKLQIRLFEFFYPLPKANSVKIVDAVKVDITKRPLAYNPADFVVRHEDNLASGSFPQTGGQSGSNLLVGTITLEPGLTEITFEYT